MTKKDLFIELNGQMNYIGVPEKPNGYGILILGGENTYVKNGEKDFDKNEHITKLVNDLIDKGYIIGYSNSHNKSWGSPLAKQDILYLQTYMSEQFHLNPSFHVIGISMGGILALDLLTDDAFDMKTMVLYKPIMDLKRHREYILNIKKIDEIGEELSTAYHLNIHSIDNLLESSNILKKKFKFIPIKVMHGKVDTIIPYENNKAILTKMYRECKRVKLNIIPFTNHNDDNLLFNNISNLISFLKENQ